MEPSFVNEAFELDEKTLPESQIAADDQSVSVDVKSAKSSGGTDGDIQVDRSSSVSSSSTLEPAKVNGDVEKSQPNEEEAADERGAWKNKLDFLFSCISVSVGLGNIWRFPYLCYRNGGGAFLIAYFVAMIFCGIPIFFQEVALGQYLGAGGMTFIGELVPIMKGVGFATMVVVFLIDIYYIIIIAWTLFYLIASFTAIPSLPWDSCNNTWNTPLCYVLAEVNVSQGISNTSKSAVEEFWTNRVLSISDGIEDFGAVRWELFGTLILAWVFVYFIIWKGLHQSGYIVWFTALFPYVILFVLLVRAVTLEGAGTGLLYYITPDWDRLAKPDPWIDGTTQIFFAYSIGTGALPALGSYNTFKYNCFRDAMITCVVNTLTCLIAGVVTFSVLGNLAVSTGQDISAVVNSGPGLVFITYPEVVLRLPGAWIWAVLFFIMLAILGIDSEFCNVESFVTGVADNWPNTLRKNKKLFTLGSVLVLFLFDISMVTEGGVYLFNLMDYYSASGMPMLFLVFFQTISINWIFGGTRFCDCVEQMTGSKPPVYFYFCWVFFGPLVMAGIFMFFVVQFAFATYGDYEYPWWAQMLGIFISLASMLWIPGYAIYYTLTTQGDLREVVMKGITPVLKPRTGAPQLPKTRQLQIKNLLNDY